MKSIITSENLLNIRLVPASCMGVLEVTVVAYLLSRHMSALLYFLSAYIFSVQLFNTRASLHTFCHTLRQREYRNQCLKGKKKHLNEQRWAAGRYLTQVTLWAHHWFWWQPLPYRTDDILFKRAGRWQDKKPVLSGESFGSTALNKSLYFSLPLSLSQPLHSFI